ncbi:phage tail protein [Serratia marcescens]|uniref:phage tail protein n=1 Tax=Serratia marcescens TaxID=615 RepID=UPI000CDD8C5F|nr:phage tail protein [Serratia marcescens]AVE50827.1 phage tail protein [Serratia marcescens]POX21420.1 phage tail protein [Serratia marcescens]HAT5012316.1 tail fiber protein [Serratia marcescens]HAT5014091.1 tail fiber protein [Serratia marcescens]
MYHLDNASSVPDMPPVNPVLFSERRFFTEGGDGISPSYPGADWFNIIQMEMLNVLALANITPDKSQFDQFAKAIRIFSSDYMIPPGIPLPWPGAIAPAGFALMLGQSFNTAVYTRLAQAYPNGVIPDMRSQTIKFLPASGRALLSYEADSIKSHGHGITIDDTNLGTVTASTFDHGSKVSSDNGEHDHDGGMAGPGAAWDGDYIVGSDNDSHRTRNKTNRAPNHNHSTYIGPHNHTVYIGPHRHTASVSSTGGSENTVKNIAFNAIVRLA